MNRNDRFKEFFKAEKISQKDFAERLDSTQQYVSALLNGKRKVGSNVIDRLESEFDMNISWFLTGEGSMKKGEAGKEPEANDEQENYRVKDLQVVHMDLKNDLKELSAGMTRNFEAVSDGVFESLKQGQKLLRGQKKIHDFIDSLNAEEMMAATSKLRNFLEEQHK